MNEEQAITHINILKNLWFKIPRNFSSELFEWCDNHECIAVKIGTYDAYPVLKYKDTNKVCCFMNEHGYDMNSMGVPCHPLADSLGLSEELNAYLKTHQDICSLCETKVRKCAIICDNSCGKIYCSDACAEADTDHHCGESEDFTNNREILNTKIQNRCCIS